uniref:RNA binding motif protein X-linked 2 n=1 Tax=Hucho hucho TaxID=62062 RepID=A0A4W5LID2_9TELE
SLGVKETVSWHSEYKDSAWIFIGGFPYELTEGDVVCVFSHYGEIANINLVRDKKTGKSKGFCFICYEDQRSTILAVDNLNGIKGRTIRVDHVLNYRPPKDNEDMDDITKRLREEGCAPKVPDPSSSESEEEEEQYAVPVKKPKKDKKEKKKKEKALKEERERLSQTPPGPALTVRVKQEKEDLGYGKYSQRGAAEERLRSRGERPGPGVEPRNSRDAHRQEDRGFRNRHGDQQDRERDRSREDEKRRHEMGERRDGGLQLESKRTGKEEGEKTREREREGQ